MNEQSPHTTLEEKPFPWEQILSAVWLQRKWILIVSFGAAVIALGVTFLISPLYTAQTSILPELTRETGLNVGETPVSKLYPMIVSSERILQGAIYHKYTTLAYSQPVDLVEYWKIDSGTQNEQFDKALRLLRGRMDINFDTRLGTVSIGVQMEEPQLAADVANQITAELDDYTRTKRKTNATLQREFIETRMQEVENQLEKAERTLKDFRESNRRIMDSPQLLMEQERLSRDVQINSTVFIELKKQFEIAKIEEIKNIPIINVLDAARPPVRKSSPKRATTAALTFLVSLLAAISYVAFEDKGLNALRSIRSSLKKP
jgi:uncharacterized protein involved in exopolysaccharide biosynthesis